MAEIRKIVIEIGVSPNNNNNNGGGSSSSLTKPLKQQKFKNSLKSEMEIENEQAKQQMTSIVKMGVEKSLQIIKQSASLGMKRYFSLTEDYIGENNLNNFSTTVSKVSGLVSSIKTGFETGGAAGGIIGAVTWGVSEYIGYQSRINSYYSSLNATNYNTSYERTRAGLVDNGRGTEN